MINPDINNLLTTTMQKEVRKCPCLVFGTKMAKY